MRKELGKWLMDIAKYITTAVVLTSIFGDVQEKWIIYLGGSLAIVITLLAGLWLVNDKKKGKRNHMANVCNAGIRKILHVGHVCPCKAKL